MTIAVDAMGGDLAPAATVEGALRAHRERGLDVVLVGDEPRVREELRRHGAGANEVRVHHASQVVEMDDHPGQALRKKKDSSIRVAFDLCKAGQAGGMVSAGNSGAVLAGGLFVLGRLDHVDRPCIGGSLPSLGGVGRSVVVDMGGDGEGKDVFGGDFDVIATDGFTGNVLLKTAEGAVWAFGQLLKRQIQASAMASAGALLLRSQLEQVKKRVDYEEVGGAPLLGIHGVGVIAHGRSSPRAILNALSGAEAFAAQRLEEDLAAAALRGTLLFKT